MNVYDQAHGLAQAIKGSEEFKRCDALKKQIDSNESLAAMVKDFQQKNLEFQTKQMMGEQMTAEDMAQIQQLIHIQFHVLHFPIQVFVPNYIPLYGNLQDSGLHFPASRGKITQTPKGDFSMKLLIASDLHGSAFYCRALLEAFDRQGLHP